MTDMVYAGGGAARGARLADAALRAAAALWFIIAAAGLVLFAAYIVGFYGQSALDGDFAAWNRALPQGIVEGEPVGNAAVGLHLLTAAFVALCGVLQLIAPLRNAFPAFHRWNGRVYIASVVGASLAGFYMVWTRGSVLGLAGDISVSINGVLILAFAAIALSYAIAREIETHRRWAMRLFLAANGVWFFRIGFRFWLWINDGPAGFDPATFRGPVLIFLGYAQFLLPLLMLELYFRARASGRAAPKLAMAGALILAAAITATGGYEAGQGWLRRIAAASVA